MWLTMVATLFLLAGDVAEDQRMAKVDSLMNSMVRQNCQDQADLVRKKCVSICATMGESVDQKTCSGQCDEMSKNTMQECNEGKKDAKEYLGKSDKERKRLAKDIELDVP